MDRQTFRLLTKEEPDNNCPDPNIHRVIVRHAAITVSCPCCGELIEAEAC